MSISFTLTQLQYESLASLARRGAADDETKRRLNDFLKSIEKANGVTRHSLWIQWSENGVPKQSDYSFPETWPPKQRYYLEQVTRPIARSDVDKVLAAKASSPLDVLVTTDPAALLGWTQLDVFFNT